MYIVVSLIHSRRFFGRTIELEKKIRFDWGSHTRTEYALVVGDPFRPHATRRAELPPPAMMTL